MPSKPTFRVHISSSAQENVPPPPATTMTFALPGSAAEDLLQRVPASKPQAVYNIMKSQLSTWNLNKPNAGEKYDENTTSSGSMEREPCWEADIASNAVDRDRWMAMEPPGPFPL